MQGRASIDPRWNSIHEDGSDFPGETHPAMVALSTGKEISNVVMGVYNPEKDKVVWLNINAIPQFKKGEQKPCEVFTTFIDISDAKLAVQALTESELQYRTLVNSGQALIWTSTPEKKCDFFNDVWLNFTGRTLEQELGDGWVEGVHPDDLDRCIRIYNSSFDAREKFSMDYRLRSKDGTYRWLQDSGQPRYDSKHVFLGYIGHCLDISDKMLMVEQLKEKREELALINNELTIAQKIGKTGSWTYKRRTKELLGSVEALRIFGFDNKPAEFTVGNIKSCILEQEKVDQAFFDLLKKGNSYEIEFQIHPADGAPLKYIRSKAEVKNDVHGNISEIVGFFQDITNQKVSEESLRIHSLAVEQSPVMNYLTNIKGEIVYLNPKVSELTGYSKNELLGKNPRILSSGEKSKEEYQILWETLIAGKAWKGEFHNRKKNGESFWVSAYLSPISNANGQVSHYLAIEEDITQNKLIQRNILELNANLEKKVEVRTAQYKEALDRLNKIANQLPGMVYQYRLNLDGSSSFPYSSEGIYDIFRVSHKDVENDASPVFAVLHQEDYPGVVDSIEVSAKNLSVWNMEFRVKFEDGTIHWLAGNATPQRQSDGSVLWHGFITNISHKKLIEQELDYKKQRLESIIEGTNVGTWEWNIQTGEAIFNERWAEIIGYTLEELSPISIESWMKAAHPDDLKVSGELLEKHFKGELPYYSFESRMKHKNGTWIWVLDRGKVHSWDAEGNPLLMSGTHQDITEKNRVEEELRWKQSLLDYMSNASPLGFLVVDNRTDNILYFNHRFCEIWELQHIEEQMRHGELKNNDIIPFCLPILEDIPSFAESCKPLHSENNRSIIEDEIAFVENRTIRRFSTQIRGINDEYYGRFYIFEDITSRRNSQNEIIKAKEAAEKANLAKSEFLSRMSHELRTPMNSILGFAQLLEMQELAASNRKRLNHIITNGRHLLELINEVLDIAGIESGKANLNCEKLQLSELIVNAINIVQVLAVEKSVSIKFADSPSNLTVLADKLRLTQVFLNLINNAVKYNKKNGAVIIKTELKMMGDVGKAAVRISVSDNGLGIKNNDLEKLFKPFERIGAEKTEKEGTGLGLVVVKKYTEAMNGSVGVVSEPGIGSTFWIELPTEVESDIIIRQKNKENKNIEKGDYEIDGTVLYIEDNHSNYELVNDILANQCPGVKLVTSIYGNTTIRLAKEYFPDMILLDLDLPDINGHEVLKRLKVDSKTKVIPVVVLSADAMPEKARILMEAGASDYLTKPIDINKFLTIVQQYCAKKPQK